MSIHTDNSHSKPPETLEGLVERITFHHPDNGFCVLRVKVKGQRDLCTVIGFVHAISVGEHLKATGNWLIDSSYGLQFKASSLWTIAPSTKEGIEKYLASGMIRGIGEHFAKKLVEAFGEKVFEVIENDAKRLLELEGIGPKRYEQVVKSFAEQKVVREIMVFLQSHGVGTARSVRIYKTYGEQAIEKVTENPYRLALDIHGIGFKSADLIAQNMGISSQSLLRAQAGVRHCLQELANEGHCACEKQILIENTEKLLEIPAAIIEEALNNEVKVENIICESISQKNYFYLPSLYRAEQGVAQHLRRLLSIKILPWGTIELFNAIRFVERLHQVELSASQKQALGVALANKVIVITGGAGVGKTTLVKSLLAVFSSLATMQAVTMMLCAPTGRAAKRMSEATGYEAKTIHRLLEFSGEIGGFKRNANNPLETDLLIVDETSMVDIALMNQLLRALPDKAALILVGDQNQLPSVGAGTVFADIINSAILPVVHLTEIFRQAKTSQIIVNAHRINQGYMPELPEVLKNTAPKIQETHVDYQNNNSIIEKVKVKKFESDFYVIPANDSEDVFAKLIHVVTERIPQKFNLHPIRDIQILTPMQRGNLGARTLNAILQEKLNAHPNASISRFGSSFAVGDKVIQTVNNYQKECFNGDIGIIKELDLELNRLMIQFDERDIVYEADELDEVSLAYAITVHKAQGSEYPCVVIPVAMQHFMLLERNLLYTAVTRGRSLVILIGEKKAIGIAVHTQHANERVTHLTHWLVK